LDGENGDPYGGEEWDWTLTDFLNEEAAAKNNDPFYVEDNSAANLQAVHDIGFYSYGELIMRETVTVTDAQSLVQSYETWSGDELAIVINWDGSTFTESVLWNGETSFDLQETFTTYDWNTNRVSNITNWSENGEYVLNQEIDFQNKQFRAVISDSSSDSQYEFHNVFWLDNGEWSQSVIFDGETFYLPDWTMADSAWSPVHERASDNNRLALKSETVAEPKADKKDANTAYIYGGVSVAALSIFACVFMSKRKNVVSDDFQRA